MDSPSPLPALDLRHRARPDLSHQLTTDGRRPSAFVRAGVRRPLVVYPRASPALRAWPVWASWWCSWRAPGTEAEGTRCFHLDCYSAIQTSGEGTSVGHTDSYTTLKATNESARPLRGRGSALTRRTICRAARLI